MNIQPAPRYAELQVATNFSFLRGASHPDELATTAAALGLEALAVTDRNSLAGVVRAHMAAKEAGIRLVVGCRLDCILDAAPSAFAASASASAAAAVATVETVATNASLHQTTEGTQIR